MELFSGAFGFQTPAIALIEALLARISSEAASAGADKDLLPLRSVCAVPGRRAGKEAGVSVETTGRAVPVLQVRVALQVDADVAEMARKAERVTSVMKKRARTLSPASRRT